MRTLMRIHDTTSQIRLRSFRFCYKRSRVEDEMHSSNFMGSNGFEKGRWLYDLPLEMLDIILQKSYLHWILNLSIMQKDEEVIRCLISVDVCFNRRITRQRFKKSIWRYLKYFYGKTKKIHSIIRDNRHYLLNNIQTNDELIASLLSLNCMTEKQSRFVQRQCSTRDKNDELLHIMESLDERKFSNFVRCLRRRNQETVANIIENGGGVIKIRVLKCRVAMEAQLLHQNIEDLRDKTKARLHEADKLIVQLSKEGMEIVGSQLDRHIVVIWIWCRSQVTLQNCQRMYDSNQLRDALSEITRQRIPKAIIIDRNQFKKTVVVRSVSTTLTQRINTQENEYYVRGMTKLRNEIYLLCQLPNGFSTILVFEERAQFSVQKEIKVKKINSPWDIGSSEKDYCLYISDYGDKCVWKIIPETDGQHKIIKWLTTDYVPFTLSLSGNGQLLMINGPAHSLTIYGSDAEIIRSIPLPIDIVCPHHAVETSTGNVVTMHITEDDENEEEGEEEEKVAMMAMEQGKHKGLLESREGKRESNRIKRKATLLVCKLTRDGKELNRRFISSSETRHSPYLGQYISLDSDDRVFVIDTYDHKVILLDSDLKRIRVLCSTKEGKDESSILFPNRLFYDEEMKQLFVGGGCAHHVNVYTLSRN